MLIAFEGIDGCGKTTTAHALAACLRHAGKRVFVTKEPNSAAIKKRIQVLASEDPVRNNDRIYRLFLEDRSKHQKTIASFLSSKHVVIADRYLYSTFAYQHALGTPWKEIERSQRHFMVPDLTIILDIPIPVAQERIRIRGRKRTPYEKQLRIQERARYLFLSMPKRFPRRKIMVLDAAMPTGQLVQTVLDMLSKDMPKPAQ